MIFKCATCARTLMNKTEREVSKICHPSCYEAYGATTKRNGFVNRVEVSEARLQKIASFGLTMAE